MTKMVLTDQDEPIKNSNVKDKVQIGSNKEAIKRNRVEGQSVPQIRSSL
jgi:hypothetical protein